MGASGTPRRTGRSSGLVALRQKQLRRLRAAHKLGAIGRLGGIGPPSLRSSGTLRKGMIGTKCGPAQAAPTFEHGVSTASTYAVVILSCGTVCAERCRRMSAHVHYVCVRLQFFSLQHQGSIRGEEACVCAPNLCMYSWLFRGNATLLCTAFAHRLQGPLQRLCCLLH